MLIHEFNPIGVFLQETKLGSTTPCPREYICYRTQYDPVVGHHGGSLMYIRRDVPQMSFALQSSLQATAVQVDLARRYTICTIYLPPSKVVTRDELIDLIHQLPQPFMLLGDLNGRHPLWGDIVTNSKGNILSSIIENEDLGILNTGEPTHFHSQTGTWSNIDLSICSADCRIDFGWRVLDDLMGSDHFPIVISSINGPPTHTAPRWQLDKADWPLFRELSEISTSIGEFQSVDDAIDYVNSTLITAGLQSIPKSSGIFKRRPVPWWSEKCRIAHRAMRAAFTRYRKHRTDYYFIQYRKYRAKFRRQIKEARRESWSKFVSSINSNTPSSVIWKKMRKIAGKFTAHPPPVLKLDGNNVTDAKEVSDAFANYFASVSEKSDTSPGYGYRYQEEQKYLLF